jgi:precorrin-6B methylase 2
MIQFDGENIPDSMGRFLRKVDRLVVYNSIGLKQNVNIVNMIRKHDYTELITTFRFQKKAPVAAFHTFSGFTMGVIKYIVGVQQFDPDSRWLR